MRGGDSLQGIAAGLYGDSSLWYKIAEVNGLSANSALTEGTSLILPSGVVRSSYNANSFKPYDPAAAIGDTAPTAPEPPTDANAKCGTFGVILLAVVAVAVTLATAGAAAAALTPGLSLGSGISAAISVGGLAGLTTAAGASVVSTTTLIAAGAIGGAVGSAVSQGVGIATGIQDKFSWKGVALGAIGGAVGGGVAGAARGAGAIGTALQNSFVSGAVSSAVTQGIGVATGLQDSFSWAGVAAAGVGSLVGSAVGNNVGDGLGGALAKGAAGAIANAATRSALDGSSFGDNVVNAIPDVIAQALVGSIGQSLTGGRANADAHAMVLQRPANKSDGLGDTIGNILADIVGQAAGVPGAVGSLGTGLGNLTGDAIGGLGDVVGGILRSSRGPDSSAFNLNLAGAFDGNLLSADLFNPNVPFSEGDGLLGGGLDLNRELDDFDGGPLAGFTDINGDPYSFDDGNYLKLANNNRNPRSERTFIERIDSRGRARTQAEHYRLEQFEIFRNEIRQNDPLNPLGRQRSLNIDYVPTARELRLAQREAMEALHFRANFEQIENLIYSLRHQAALRPGEYINVSTSLIATRAQANRLGLQFTGYNNFSVRSMESNSGIVNELAGRSFRFPQFKPNEGRVQANFEQQFTNGARINVHVTINRPLTTQELLRSIYNNTNNTK